MDSWPVIDLKDGDEVVFAAVAEDDDRLVFISSDSSLLTFEAKNVRRRVVLRRYGRHQAGRGCPCGGLQRGSRRQGGMDL